MAGAARKKNYVSDTHGEKGSARDPYLSREGCVTVLRGIYFTEARVKCIQFRRSSGEMYTGRYWPLLAVTGRYINVYFSNTYSPSGGMDIEDILKYERHNAEPQANWEALLGAFYMHRLHLKIAFRFYALEGTASSTDADPNTMDMRQFANFAKSTGLLDRNFGLSDCDRLYMRAVRKPNGLGDKITADNPMLLRSAIALEKNETSGGEELPNAKHWWERTSMAVHVAGLLNSRKGGNVMHQDRFLSSLVRLASIKYPQIKRMADKLEALCSERLEPHVTEYLQLLKDDFSDKMHTKLMRHVLGKHRGDSAPPPPDSPTTCAAA
eukprot:7381873-Prymnesium_polylepis.1